MSAPSKVQTAGDFDLSKCFMVGDSTKNPFKFEFSDEEFDQSLIQNQAKGRKKILIVEDESLHAEELTGMFRKQHVSCKVVSNGLQALEYYIQNHSNLTAIFIDD